MRLLYEPDEKPSAKNTEVGESVYNQHDGITYTKNKYGDIIVVSHNVGNTNITNVTNVTQVQPTNLPVVPIGGIIMYKGKLVDIPSNFKLCDGKHHTPNLIDKFIKGWGVEAGLGTAGGSHNAVVVAHHHTINHDHPRAKSDTGTAHSHTAISYNSGHAGAGAIGIKIQGNHPHATTGGGHHTHYTDIPAFSGNSGNAGVAGTGKNQPAYVQLAYIMRVS